MKLLRTAIALLALAAAPACGDASTAPTDADLVGTWTIAPAAGVLPDGGVREMTVSFGPGGGYTLETATFGGFGALGSYGKSVGSVSARGGLLSFHPSGAVSLDRSLAPPLSPAALDPGAWDPAHPLSYEVVGNHLVLHLSPRAAAPPLVLTRVHP
jgi:hypothetical protein